MQLQCRLHASGMHQGSFYTGKSKMKLSWNYGGTSIWACTISVLDTMTVRALFGHSVFKFNQEMNSCCQEVISIYSHIKLNSAYKIIFLKSKLSTLNSILCVSKLKSLPAWQHEFISWLNLNGQKVHAPMTPSRLPVTWALIHDPDRLCFMIWSASACI